ncbi:MAG: pentapeptide repeat-containing protein [Anaerolineales bacterium]
MVGRTSIFFPRFDKGVYNFTLKFCKRERVVKARNLIYLFFLLSTIFVLFSAVAYLFSRICIAGLSEACLGVSQFVPQLSSQDSAIVEKTSQYVPPKTVWDLLDLMLIPIFIALIGILYSQQSTNTHFEVAEQQRRDDVVSKFITDVESIVSPADFDKSTDTPQLKDGEIATIEARLRTIVKNLDGERKSQLIHFLYKCNLLGGILPKHDAFGGVSQARNQVIDVTDVDLSRINLSGVNLAGIVLSGCELSGANLNKAKLPSANLLEVKVNKKIKHRGTYCKNAELSEDLKRYLNS